MNKRPDPEQPITSILPGLNSVDAGPAWARFIDCYSGQIMKSVRQFEYEQDRAHECFLYVCEALSDNGFRRLLAFRTDGTARFRTWLGTVVFHLCVDWHRKEFGRAQMLPAISALPAFDQSVYHLYFEQGLKKESCLQILLDEFPDLTPVQLSSSIERIYRTLTPRQRWRLSLKLGRRQDGHPDLMDVDVIRAADPSPDQQLQAERERDLIEEALRQLSDDQRLALQLKYHQGLTLKDITRIMRLGNISRTKRLLDRALQGLSERIERAEFNKI
jgi:RNA polymerase sigma factor (sigma-70 family)